MRTVKAVIYGLPLGNYWLEETTVPEGYYPTAPAKIMIGETNSIEVPYKAVIPNSVFVKLGLDRDKYNVPIAIGVNRINYWRCCHIYGAQTEEGKGEINE